MGLLELSKKYNISLELKAKNELEAKAKADALNLLAKNIDTDNLIMLSRVSTRLGVNMKMRHHAKDLLNI
jgi:hypothetical protein